MVYNEKCDLFVVFLIIVIFVGFFNFDFSSIADIIFLYKFFSFFRVRVRLFVIFFIIGCSRDFNIFLCFFKKLVEKLNI